MIEKLEEYQFPLHCEAAANYLDLVIRQQTGKKTASHSVVDDSFTLNSRKDVDEIIKALQHPIGIADCTR